jgi:hypothetical protein
VSGQLALQLDGIGPIAMGTRQVQRGRIDLQELPRFHADIVPYPAIVREGLRLPVAFEPAERG